jgi:hypothetical protein
MAYATPKSKTSSTKTSTSSKKITQPKSGVGSVAETNRLLGGNYFDTSSGKQVKEFTASDANRNAKNYTDRSVQDKSISPESMTPTPEIRLPEPSIYNPGAIVTANNQGLSAPKFGFTTDANGLFVTAPTDESALADQRKESMTDFINQKLGIKPPNAEQIYKESGAREVEKARREVNNYTGQINTIVAKAQADTLAVTGQGRGIPEVIIGGQQAQINKEAAIQALPIQALLANAQGNLELAQTHLDTMFKIKMADATAQFEYKTKLYDSIRDFTTKEESRQLALLDQKNDREYKETQALNDEQKTYAKMAFSTGQSQLGAQIAQLNYKSPTFKNDLAKLQAQIKDPTLALDLELKRAQIASANRANQPEAKGGKLVKVNGKDYIQNADGSLSNPVVPDGGQNKVIQEFYKDKINQIDDLIKSPALKNAVGTNALGRFSFSEPFTTKRGNFIANVDQIAGQAVIDNLINIKKAGGTFGALSEKELALLQASATKIKSWEREYDGRVMGYETTEEEFKKELNNLKIHTQRLLEADGGIDAVADDDDYLNTVEEVLNKTINDPFSSFLTDN